MFQAFLIHEAGGAFDLHPHGVKPVRLTGCRGDGSTTHKPIKAEWKIAMRKQLQASKDRLYLREDDRQQPPVHSLKLTRLPHEASLVLRARLAA